MSLFTYHGFHIDHVSFNFVGTLEATKLNITAGCVMKVNVRLIDEYIYLIYIINSDCQNWRERKKEEVILSY